MVESDIEFTLIVPEQQLRRVTLIEAARKTVKSAHVIPPTTLDVLEQLAADVIATTNGNSNEMAFAMLICNNELWRPNFEATPYNRRLLLMPQCLRNSISCRAIFDELGLICSGCNQCSINTILEEAETLGYSTLVAEGTTTAISLVEEGSVDAILGVSCMETLQKSFKHVVTSAIPSLAIPLLNNGCADTKVDQQWLLSEIKSQNENPDFEPLSVSLLKNQVENLFSAEFLSAEFGKETGNTFTQKLAVNSILQGGKRMRPLLTLMVYSAYSKTFDQEIANQLMLMVECFHKASLIHDDIEDQDNYRYQKKTTHNENGIPLAINLGDYLIGQGYLKLNRLQIEPDIKLQLFDLFSTMHVESTIGQGEELAMLENKTIANINSTLTIFRQKTGSAIQVSLLAGAIAANAPETEQQLLKEFSDLFGIAYQIRDDLTEFRGTATDQQEASYPYLKSILFEKCKVTTTSQQQLKELITELEIDKTAQTELDATLSNLKVCLNKLESQKLRLALLNSVNRIFEL